MSGRKDATDHLVRNTDRSTGLDRLCTLRQLFFMAHALDRVDSSTLSEPLPSYPTRAQYELIWERKVVWRWSCTSEYVLTAVDLNRSSSTYPRKATLERRLCSGAKAQTQTQKVDLYHPAQRILADESTFQALDSLEIG